MKLGVLRNKSEMSLNVEIPASPAEDETHHSTADQHLDRSILATAASGPDVKASGLFVF